MKSRVMDFDKVRSILDDIPAINMGGCGVVAYAMYKWSLSKGVPKDKMGFVYLFSYEKHPGNKYLEKIRLGEKAKANSATHIVFRHGNTYYDTENEYDEFSFLENYSDYKHVDDPKILLRSLNVLSCWNDWFDRTYSIPTIEKKLGISLKEIKVPR
jgi:hypothetical protein